MNMTVVHKQKVLEVKQKIQTNGEDAPQNILVCGDALDALDALAGTEKYEGNVRVIYIDPPFNTHYTFQHYTDALSHQEWVEMFRLRVLRAKRFLAPNGSIWVHLDDCEVHRARLLLDEIFGEQAFVATIVWQKRVTRENRAAFSPAHDYILVYAPMGGVEWKAYRNNLSRSGDFRNPDNDPKGPWASIPFTAKGYRKNQVYPITTPTGVVYQPPFKNRCWGATKAEFERLLSEGRVYFPRNGAGKPRLKLYQFEDKGIVPETWWTAEECGTNDSARKHLHELFPGEDGFATPKPEQLLRRVLSIASNPGDIVLDFFLGSGTTAAVAHKMGRSWIGVEVKSATIQSYTLPRLIKVVRGEDTSGISEEVGWEGGGGFILCKIGS